MEFRFEEILLGETPKSLTFGRVLGYTGSPLGSRRDPQAISRQVRGCRSGSVAWILDPLELGSLQLCTHQTEDLLTH